jgi:hypothetical protein
LCIHQIWLGPLLFLSGVRREDFFHLDMNNQDLTPANNVTRLSRGVLRANLQISL